MPPREAVARQAKQSFGPWELGIDERTAPQNLKEGKCAAAQNLLLDEIPGAMVKRQGSSVLSTLPSGLPARDGYTFAKSDGTSYFLASDGVTLYYTTDPSVQASWTQLIAGLNSDGFMEFETAEDKVWMSNGIGNVMSWDGATLFTYDRVKVAAVDSTTVTATTTISNDFTEADNYWVNQKIVWTVGNNVGFVATVTAYVQSTKKITFTPALPNAAAVTDRWTLGLVIPIVRVFRFWDGHLFGGSSTVNASELRFHRNFDPNTGAFINIDHPLAWPATFQLNIYSNDGDRVWTISPILRDRILIGKASGIFRLERDPLVVYRPEVVSREAGTRFHRSWGEKKGMLYFLGQARDGYPDVFRTDMVNVGPVDPDGGIEPTLRALQQPNSILQSVTLATKSAFDAGTKSSMLKTSGNALEIGGYAAGSDWQGANLVSGLNVDIETTPGIVALLGHPKWEVSYDRTVLPPAANPPWAQSYGGDIANAIGASYVNYGDPGNGNIYQAETGQFQGYIQNYRAGVLAAAQDAFLEVKFISQVGGGQVSFGLLNGAVGVVFTVNPGNGIYVTDTGLQRFTGVGMPSGYGAYSLLLKANGTYKLWVNGVLAYSGTAGATTLNMVTFGLFGAPTLAAMPSYSPGNPATLVNFSAVNYHSNYKGDSLQSFGGAITVTALPNNFPTSGQIVMLNDLTRAPDALRRLYWNDGNVALGVCGVTAASLTVNIAPGTNMGQFYVGQVVDLKSTATGLPITNGLGQTIASLTSSTIVFSNAIGVVTTDGTVSVYPKTGSITAESWTSDTVNFSTGNDGAGYLATAITAVPGSAVKRAQRIRLTLTASGDFLHNPQLTALYSGIFWLSAPLPVDSKIAAWRTMVDLLTTPGGVDQFVKMRYATVVTVPIETDWQAFSASMASGANIGTATGDTATPPAARWIQFKVEEGLSAAALFPIVQALVAQWLTGSAVVLPLLGIVHKKRYIVCAAALTSTTNNSVIVSDRNDAWMKYAGLSLNGMVHFKTQLIGLSSVDAKILLLDAAGVYTDQGAAIDAYLVTRVEAMGDPQLRKNLRYFYLYPGAAIFALTVSYMRQGDPAFVGAVTFNFIGDGQSGRGNFPTATIARGLQRKYENAVAGQNMYLLGETIYFDRRPLQP